MTLPGWLELRTAPAPAGAIVLDGAACRTRAGLFAEFARALRFPAYFGHNWDALTDCLRDAAPELLYVSDAGQLLTDEPPAQLTTLLDVLGGLRGGVILGVRAAELDALAARIAAS